MWPVEMMIKQIKNRSWQFPPVREEQADALARRVKDLRSGLHDRDPLKLAAATGATFETGVFHLEIFHEPFRLSFPDLEVIDPKSGQPMPVFMQALLLYYFITADGTPLTGRWISFADLPGGRIYNQAYQGYTGDILARQFGSNLPRFEQASSLISGTRIAYGDAAYAFQALPRVTLSVVMWQTDDEFPASGKVLFDSSVTHYLPPDVCAILGSMLTRKITTT
jgi:hypothetical protein